MKIRHTIMVDNKRSFQTTVEFTHDDGTELTAAEQADLTEYTRQCVECMPADMYYTVFPDYKIRVVRDVGVN